MSRRRGYDSVRVRRMYLYLAREDKSPLLCSTCRQEMEIAPRGHRDKGYLPHYVTIGHLTPLVEYRHSMVVGAHVVLQCRACNVADSNQYKQVNNVGKAKRTRPGNRTSVDAVPDQHSHL